MRTDTEPIPVIDVAPVCSWCEIPLAAIPDRAVIARGRHYHPSCARAAQQLAEALTVV